ncbi:MAG: hypothetical protein B6244_08600 [Candidatus Cloacimonetes bacterium 4572_55]|nr:MAG: hypothetical protein B6244_08600 [Candidatus Cloacimonetes bacterium 4572_55]
MQYIESRTNPRIKWLRSLQLRKNRAREQLFIAEGVRLLEEALYADNQKVFHTLVVCPEIIRGKSRASQLIEALQKKALRIIHVAPQVMKILSETKTSQGIMAVFPIVPRHESRVGLGLVLDGIQDPGNMGTILRTAWAADVTQVYLIGESVDPYHPKVVRSGMGAHFHLSISLFSEWNEIDFQQIIRPGTQIVIADSHADISYRKVEWNLDTLLIIGSEAHGIRSAILASDHPIVSIKIPMSSRVESLNASVAAGILLMDAYRCAEQNRSMENPAT